MSGGGGRPLSGRMLTSLDQVRKSVAVASPARGKDDDDPKQLAALEKQLAGGDVDLARLREARGRLEEVVARLTRERDEAERTVKRCQVCNSSSSSLYHHHQRRTNTPVLVVVWW